MTTEVAKQETSDQQNSMLVFSSLANFENAQRMAKCLAASTIIPVNYQGDKNISNCIIALEMANRIGASPLMVMQNLYIVHGNPGWSSKFLIAALNSCGRFAPLRYEFKGKEGADDWGCRAYTHEKNDKNSILFGSWVTIGMAKAENWYGKAGSKWKTMPELMLQYRAAAFFQRAYAPEISMGMQTAEELNDIQYHESYRDVIDAEIIQQDDPEVVAAQPPRTDPDSSEIKPNTDFRSESNGNGNGNGNGQRRLNL